MLSTDPEKRPSVDQLSEIPKIKLRMSERETREQYSKYKEKEAEILKKSEELKEREAEISKKEEALKIRELKAQEMRLKLSLNTGLKFGDLYHSIENKRVFEKMVEESQKENRAT